MSEGDKFVAEMHERYSNVDEFREDFLGFWKHYKKVGVDGACDDATMRIVLNCGELRIPPILVTGRMGCLYTGNKWKNILHQKSWVEPR